MKIYTYDEALEASLKYFSGNELAAKVFVDKYALRNKDNKLLEDNPDKMHWRIAKEFARIEKRKFKEPLSEEEIYSYLKGFKKIIPQGSPMAGIGNKEQYLSLSNCYVLSVPEDSYSSILATDEEIVNISKRRGGVGICLDKLRPKGLPVNNAARTSTGIIAWMERYSNTIREVGQHGRRGAMMQTLNVHHPDILSFIEAKKDLTKVTGANISVQYTNEFLDAVDKDIEYEQRWPINDPVITKKIKARDVWGLVVENSWLMAEPGLIFQSNIIKNSIPHCYKKFGFEEISQNPCSELNLCSLDSCRLLLINLFNYINHPFTKEAIFDYNRFYQDAQVAQRLMDNLIDLELECVDRIIDKVENQDTESIEIRHREINLWKKIKEKCFNGRRTGTGITALGDTLAALGIKYGSKKSIDATEQIYRTLKLGCYRSSVNMAKELGPFPIFDPELEKDNPFLLRIKEENIKLYNDIKKYGRRNIALLTTSPAGSVSLVAQLQDGFFGTTSGIEPLFMQSHIRRKKGNPGDKDFRSDFVDKNGDHWMHFDVNHAGIDLCKQINQINNPYEGCCAEEINWQNRVKLQAIAQKHIDHSISSTINLPSDISQEEVDKIFMTAWKSGCNGITVYRKGSRDGVLIEKNKVIERPKELDCDVFHSTVKGKSYFVLIGLYDNKPYEVFGGLNGDMNTKVNKGKIIRVRKRRYKAILEDGDELSPINYMNDENEDALTRLTSTALQAGCDLNTLVTRLERTQGSMTAFSRAISRALKKYIPDGKLEDECPECGQCNLRRESGCLMCTCGYSRCN